MCLRASHLLVIAVLGAPAVSAATQVFALDLDTMVDTASVACWGTVTSVTSARADGRIETTVVVQPSEVLKRDEAQRAGEPVSFVIPGGVVGRMGQWVPGVPRFQPGMEVVLLLERQRVTGRLLLVGLPQGRYVVERRTTPEIPEAVSDRSGVGLLTRGKDGRLESAPDAARLDRRPLGDLLSRIRLRAQHRP